MHMRVVLEKECSARHILDDCVAIAQTLRNTSAGRMVVEKRYAFQRGEKGYGETPTGQAETPGLLVDFVSPASGRRARIGGPIPGDCPAAATDPILCRAGRRDALANRGALLQAQLTAAYLVVGSRYHRHENRCDWGRSVDGLPADCRCLAGLLAGGCPGGLRQRWL